MVENNEEQKELNPAQAEADNSAIAVFTEAMKGKLTLKRYQGFSRWLDCKPEYLEEKLQEQLNKPERDMVDIANYCMMLHFVNQKLSVIKE